MLPFFAGFLAIGLWPLVVIVAASIAIIVAIGLECEGWATASLVVGAGLLAFLTHTNPFLWAQHNVGTLLLGVGGYFALGLIWAVVKWYFFLLNERDAQIDNRRGYSNPKDAPALRAPKVANHRGRILAWMTYWPWSAFWTLLNDPVRRAWRFIYERVARLLQKMSDHVFAGAPAE